MGMTPIRRARLERGLTQEEAARRAKVSLGTFVQADSGRAVPRSRTLLKIARAFNCSMEELVPTEDPTEAPMRGAQLATA